MNIFDTLKYIEIETHSACTRECPWCLFGAYPDFRPSEQTFLDTEYIYATFRNLYEHGFLGVIGLFSINEPLMDIRISSGQLITACKKIFRGNVLVTITTNGDLLTQPLVDHLFSCGLDSLKISCYSIERFFKFKKMFSSYSTVVVLDQTRYLDGKFESNRGGSLFDSPISFNSCYYPQYRAAIGWNGEVRICYNDILQKKKIGNIKNMPLCEILESNKMSILRENIRTQRFSEIPCCNCNVCGHEEKLIQFNQTINDELQRINRTFST